MRKIILIPLLLLMPVGCCLVTQQQDTPVKAQRIVEPKTRAAYWIYVPSTYKANVARPLVVTLHGGGVCDSARAQIREWKYLAEKRELIVVAPELESATWMVPSRANLKENLGRDERAVLAIIDEVKGNHQIANRDILLTGFLEGGYPLYYIGLRNAGRFGMLIARDCYVDMQILKELELDGQAWREARQLEMLIFNGKDSGGGLAGHGWRAYRFLRENHCLNAKRKEMAGGRLRRPEKAYKYWRKYRNDSSR